MPLPDFIIYLSDDTKQETDYASKGYGTMWTVAVINGLLKAI